MTVMHGDFKRPVGFMDLLLEINEESGMEWVAVTTDKNDPACG